MKIFFISGVYSHNCENVLRSLCKNAGLEIASNTFQWAFIEGMYSNRVDFEVVSFPFLPAYPMRFKKMYVPSSNIDYNGVNIGQMLTYNAFFLIKGISIKMRLYRYLQKQLKDKTQQEEDVWVISYTPYAFFAQPIIKLKRKYPNLKYCTIITDLIEDATSSVFKLSTLKYIQVKLEQRIVRSVYRYIDKFVLISKYMEEKIDFAKGRNIVVEGIASKVNTEDISIEDSTQKKILYTGALEAFTGIVDFIQAFSRTTDCNYRLIICGLGGIEDQIKQVSLQDSRIDYMGNLPRAEVLSLQKHATLLVNPRKPSVELTRYSFPSKTIEYMASGTPMLGYALDGIPEEYYDYMYIPKDLSVEAMTDAINEILTKSAEELRQFGSLAKEFIRNNKEAHHQVAKVIRFLNQ